MYPILQRLSVSYYLTSAARILPLIFYWYLMYVMLVWTMHLCDNMEQVFTSYSRVIVEPKCLCYCFYGQYLLLPFTHTPPLLTLLLFAPAYEWQGHKKPLHPVSVEVDEKRRLQVSDTSGAALRCLNLGNQDYIDVRLSNDRHCRALLLKVAKEYDLVSGWGEERVVDLTIQLMSDSKLQEKNCDWCILCKHVQPKVNVPVMEKLQARFCRLTLFASLCLLLILFTFLRCPPFVHPAAVFWWRE